MVIGRQNSAAFEGQKNCYYQELEVFCVCDVRQTKTHAYEFLGLEISCLEFETGL